MTVTTQVFNSPDSIEILATSTGPGATTLFNVSAAGSNVNLVTAGPLDRETTPQFILVLKYVVLCICVPILCLYVYASECVRASMLVQ